LLFLILKYFNINNNKVNKMNKLNKLFVVILSSLFISVQAFAGELGVSGSAKASYVINGGDDKSTGIGISNELNFTAAGELDNGFTWSYSTELDGNDGGAHDNDDSQIVFGLGGMGTLGIMDSEGGLSTETGMGIGAMGVGDDYANTGTIVGNDIDVSSYGNIQYHLPADALPFGLGAKVAYVPNTADGDNNSYKNGGGQNTQGVDGDSATMGQITASPVDGLKIGADYITFGNDSGVVYQSQEAGGFYANYSYMNFKVGYGERYYAPGLSAKVNATAADGSYITDQIGVEFAVNDALSVSYMEEESERKTYGAAVNAAAGASPYTKATVTAKSTYLMAAYDIGGATLGITNVDTSNSAYVIGADRKLTIVSMAMAF
jgi:hypothetical protein